MEIQKPFFGECSNECTTDWKVPKKFNLDYFRPTFPDKLIAPVKISIFETDQAPYRRHAYGSAFLTFAYFSVGSCFIVFFFFCSAFKIEFLLTIHLYFFALGFLLFLPCSMFHMHFYNGAVSASTKKRRKRDWFWLKVGFFFCVTCGTAAVSFTGLPKLFLRVWSSEFFSFHVFFGVVAVAFVLLDMLNFFFSLFQKLSRHPPRIAALLTLPTLTASALCTFFALVSTAITDWLPQLVFPFVLMSLLYYNLLTCYETFRNVRPRTRYINTYYL